MSGKIYMGKIASFLAMTVGVSICRSGSYRHCETPRSNLPQSMRLLCSLIIVVLSVFTTHAQVQVSARIDSTSILIGSQTNLRLTAAFDVKNGVPKIQFPQIADSLASKVEVISKSKITTIIPDSAHPNVQQQVQDITISSFDSGYYAIPAFKFIINGDTANAQLTEAMMLQVNTVHVDTTKAFKDIKAPLQASFTWLEYLPYIGYGLLALLVLGAIIYFIIRATGKEKTDVVEAPKEIIPPHVKALQELENLANKKLWQEGKIKDYYTGITDILRVYLEERYGITALEMTTDEIMVALKRKDINEMMKQKLRDILVLSDLVKFAKENPLPTDHEFCFNSSIGFVNETAPSSVEKNSEPKPAEQNIVTQ